MKAPSYSWVCHRCQAANAAGAAVCAQCTFPAFADGRAIADAQPKPAVAEPRVQGEHWLARPSSIWLFFPEGLLAVGVVLASPFWLLSLLAAGKLGPAFVLFVGIGAAAALVYLGFKGKSQTTVWVSVVVALFTWCLTSSASQGG